MAEPLEVELLDGTGWVFLNVDTGEEYAPNHPIRSGEVPDAQRIRRSTAQEDVLWAAFQGEFERAHALETKLAATPDQMAGVDGEVEQADRDEAMRLVRGDKVGAGDGGTYTMLPPNPERLATALARHRRTGIAAGLEQAAQIAEGAVSYVVGEKRNLCDQIAAAIRQDKQP